jgi:hypothetical protein
MKAAGILCVATPPAKANEWQADCVQRVEQDQWVKASAPGVRYRMNEARASSAPWVDTNAPHFLRQPRAKFLIAGGDGKSALAAAEAWVWEVDAAISAPEKDWKALGDMQRFLKAIPAAELPVLANVGFLDDGSMAALENMKLMLRRNLLFRSIQTADPSLAVNVKPKPGDPSEFAYEVRKKVGDESRFLRVYGSEVVIARLTGDSNRRRVMLLNYGNRPPEGLRVRVLGRFPNVKVYSPGGVSEVRDIETDATGTEFSLNTLPLLAVIDLTR